MCREDTILKKVLEMGLSGKVTFEPSLAGIEAVVWLVVWTWDVKGDTIQATETSTLNCSGSWGWHPHWPCAPGPLHLQCPSFRPCPRSQLLLNLQDSEGRSGLPRSLPQPFSGGSGLGAPLRSTQHSLSQMSHVIAWPPSSESGRCVSHCPSACTCHSRTHSWGWDSMDSFSITDEREEEEGEDGREGERG